MMLWQATPASLWQGRDDSGAPNALRLFQTIVRAERFAPQEMPAISRCSASPVTKGSGVTKRAYRADGPATRAGRWPIWPAIRVMTAAWIWAPSASTASS